MAWPLAGLFAASVLVSAACAAGWRRLARRRGWVDTPGARRLHQGEVPRGGGVGIALAGGLAAATLAATGAGPWSGFLAGLALLALVGLADDLRPLGAPPKFLAQSLAALGPALAWPLPPGGASGVLAAWALVMVLVNFWNFMDGSDGMAAGLAVVAAPALAWLAPSPAALVLAAWLAGACLGFLPFNRPRATLFLGDVGSFVLGYGLAVLLLVALAAPSPAAWLLWLPLSAVLADAGLTLAGRLLRAEPVWRAHAGHLYQRAIRRGHGHGRVGLAYVGWSLGAGLLAAATQRWAPGAAPAVAAAWALLAITVYLAGRRWLADPAGAGA